MFENRKIINIFTWGKIKMNENEKKNWDLMSKIWEN